MFYKFSDELLSIYKFWKNFGKILEKFWKNIYYKIFNKKIYTIKFGKKIFNKKIYTLKF